MANITVNGIRRRDVSGAGRLNIVDIAWNSSYASGGDSYTNALLGVDPGATIDAIDCAGASAAGNTGYVVIADLANKKLKLLGGAASGVALAQASGDQSGTTARLFVYWGNPYI